MTSSSSQILKVQLLLQERAAKGEVIYYAELFALFPEDTLPVDMYTCLEVACLEICELDVANYSAIMAKRDDGLPGDGFFDMYRNQRPEKYAVIAGDARTLDLTSKQKREIASLERACVYENAVIFS